MTSLQIHKKEGTPKYQKLIDWVEESIVSKELKKGDQLPSINTICKNYSLSRDTVLLAFRILKERGIVNSVPGKGYFIKSANIKVQKKVFMLLDELNSFKEDLCNSFVKSMGKDVQIDFFFHHFNPSVMKSLIEDNIGQYNVYVIMPAHLKGVKNMIKDLPQDKVYILDQTSKELHEYPAIYQNFEEGIFSFLQEVNSFFSKYKEFILLFENEKQPQGIIEGFNRFQKENVITQRVISILEGRIVRKGEVYFVLDDRSLIVLIKKIREQGLVLGKDIGIISYNDTILKEVFEGGITTISTDFKKMGARLSEMIKNQEKGSVENESYYAIRNSL